MMAGIMAASARGVLITAIVAVLLSSAFAAESAANSHSSQGSKKCKKRTLAESPRSCYLIGIEEYCDDKVLTQFPVATMGFAGAILKMAMASWIPLAVKSRGLVSQEHQEQKVPQAKRMRQVQHLRLGC